MKKENYLSWDSYFMSVALLSSFRSKDNKTQTGACIVDINKKIVGVGYNGLPKGLDDNDERFWNDDDTDLINSKHTYVVHAEQNAIHNKITQNIDNSTLYVTLFPCKECAKSIIQVGIKTVVFLDYKEHHEKQNEAVKLMFDNCKIKYNKFEELEIKDKEFIEKLMKVKP
jgi:dCMP deaminase